MSGSEYSPGLEGVVAGETAICTITDAGLTYRGYGIEDLAERASFEEVAYLLLLGELPTSQQLQAFRAELNAEWTLPAPLARILVEIPRDAPMMDVVRSGASLLAHFDREVADNSHEANLRKAVRLLAQIPTFIATRQALLKGKEPPQPRPDLSHAANLLLLLTGREPDALATRVMDVSLILYAEHEYNASAFAARVAVSTLADLHAGITAAISALKGPLHGGANERAMETMLAISEPELAEEWVLNALGRRERIMGFGHRVLRQGDTRARILSEYGHRLAAQLGDTRWARIAEIMESVMEREKGLRANVDFPCGWVYYLLGLPVELYTPIFVCSRISGWSAHIIEQLDNNRLIRPRSLYTGPTPGRAFVPLAERAISHEPDA